MPRKSEMSWEGKPYFRWAKMYRGVRYRVTCEQLGAMVFTEDATRKQANDWWARKLLEIEGAGSGLAGEAAVLAAAVVQASAEVAAATAARDILRTVDAAPDAAKAIVAAVVAARESVTAAAAPVTSDFTVSLHVEKFLAVQQLRGKSVGTFGDLAYYVRRFPSMLAPDVRSIDETTVSNFYSRLRSGSDSASVQRKVWGYFRRFVHHCWSEKLIELPRNLDNRTFSFDVSSPVIKTYSVSAVQDMYAALPSRLQLYACLALNCGMLGVDMAHLRFSEYQDGRIIRRRTKTRAKKNVPTVNYKLWPETVALLERWKASSGEYVLTSSVGTPLWTARIEDGKKVKSDLVALQWNRGRGEGRASKPAIPLKNLRSVAATLLESHPQHRHSVTLFLAHAPSTIAQKHYAAPSQELFDEAITWLRSQIFVSTV